MNMGQPPQGRGQKRGRGNQTDRCENASCGNVVVLPGLLPSSLLAFAFTARPLVKSMRGRKEESVSAVVHGSARQNGAGSTA